MRHDKLLPSAACRKNKKRWQPTSRICLKKHSLLRFIIAGLALSPLAKAPNSFAGYSLDIKDQPDWMKIPMKWIEPKKPVPAHSWTGSLLSPSPSFPKGMWALEPYTVATVPTGNYDSHGNLIQHGGSQYDSLTSSWFFKGAPTDHLSVDITPAFSYSWTPQDGTANKNSHVGFDDLPFDLEYRFTDTYSPSISVVFGASAPTGAYNNLERAADGVGAGVWKLRYGFNGQFVEPFFKQAMRVRWWAVARTPLGDASLKNTTSYGTGEGFRGSAHPGSTGEEGIAVELGITKRWLFALDLYEDWGSTTNIRGTYSYGHNGCTQAQCAFSQNTGWSTAWSAAPAIEYAPNGVLGLIAGVQVTAAGHNTSRTLAPQIAVMYAW
ncbi:hypothetical protein FAI40_03300 [Acetobacteraceae bacterium]|nr:hypothetical protein FAI40_03300 [Acetobacteraceae bacterium]